MYVCGGGGGIFTAFGFSRFTVVTGSEHTAGQGMLLHSTFSWGTLASIKGAQGLVLLSALTVSHLKMRS